MSAIGREKWSAEMRRTAYYYPLVLLPLVVLTGCDRGIGGVWQGTMTTSETVIDRYGSRTAYATTPFAVKLDFDGTYLNGLVKWGTLDMNDPASVIDSRSIAYGTVVDGSIHFCAQTSTAAAPAMGTYSATVDGNTMAGTMYCIGEGYENAAQLVGEFTLTRE